MKKTFYEVTYIVNPVLEEAETKAEIDKINSFITRQGGEIDEVNEWGNRRLTYEMSGKQTGYFVNMYFTSPGELIVKLERMMQINENIVRYLTLKYDKKMLRHREMLKKGEVPNIFKVIDQDPEA